MRTITLELLRHGPAHNQLMSPLTPYLALCENHEAATLHLPLEHQQLLHRLRALSYRLGEESRQFQLHDTARLLADLLAAVPGLAAELNAGASTDGSGNAAPLAVHLRLVLSASELALLPFELALAPPGCPGAGQPLLLQPHSPLCITRETRRFAETTVRWPQETRVLMVAASPAGVEPVPALAHLLALRGRLQPWIGSPDQVDRHLSLITDASLDAVAQACAEQAFTHVHILAHGAEYSDGQQTRHGLLLHAADDPGRSDTVSGERLASALRSVRRGGSGAVSCPAVVTLASCNSAAVGNVTGIGASIAHALHQGGIPMVIASQFPLSFGGSVRMVEALYEGLLWGDDPRALLIDLRRQLHTQFPASHDWASLTAYSSLPADFDSHLARAQIQRAMASINVALDGADALVARLAATDGEADAAAEMSASAEAAAAIDSAIDQVRKAKQRLQLLSGRRADQRVRIRGLLASTDKREAELSHERSRRTADAQQCEALREAMWSALARARQQYFGCQQAEPTSYWTTQYLSLQTVLRLAGRDAPRGLQAGGPQAECGLWQLAEGLALHDLNGGDPPVRIWALGNLIELYLLAPAIAGLPPRDAGWRALAVDHAEQLLSAAAERPFEVFSTRRQVQRYRGWYAALAADGQSWPAELLASAADIAALLPSQPLPDWNYAEA